MTLSRRSFIRGTLSLAAVASVPLVARLPSLPVIYGDGVRDDAAGLQAMFDGLPFDVQTDAVRVLEGQMPVIDGGRFVLSRGLILRRMRVAIVRDTRFLMTDELRGAMFTVTEYSVLKMEGDIGIVAPFAVSCGGQIV